MSLPVIDISRVRKVYRGNVEAIRDISLQVGEGSVFGLLGPNGAGKSTLVKILTTIIRATDCEGTMLGQPIGHKPTLKQVGYLPEHARFPSYLSGRQVIEYVAGLSGAEVSQQRIDELLALVGMSQAGGRLLKTYSKGMVQRLGVAQALVNDPRLIFLDEPTDGVDPEGRRAMRELLMRLREEGRTVFINSHLLGELETVCDSLVILKEGIVVKQGSLVELTRDTRRYEVLVTSLIPDDLAVMFREDGLAVEAKLVSVPGGDPQLVQPVLDALRRDGMVIEEVRQVRQSLEDLFLESVSGHQKEGVGAA